MCAVFSILQFYAQLVCGGKKGMREGDEEGGGRVGEREGDRLSSISLQPPLIWDPMVSQCAARIPNMWLVVHLTPMYHFIHLSLLPSSSLPSPPSTPPSLSSSSTPQAISISQQAWALIALHIFNTRQRSAWHVLTVAVMEAVALMLCSWSLCLSCRSLMLSVSKYAPLSVVQQTVACTWGYQTVLHCIRASIKLPMWYVNIVSIPAAQIVSCNGLREAWARVRCYS